MRTYLSIDVDYWRDHTAWIAFQDMDRFFQRVINLKVPMLVVEDHHKILKDINRRKFDTLVNMDYHSDLTSYIDRDNGVYEYHKTSPDSRVKGNLNCGTWVNFVKRRETSEYLWIYPKDICLISDGRCEDIDIFWNEPASEFHNWGKITCQKGWSKYIPWGTVKAVGIALSSPWLYEELEGYFIEGIYPKLVAKGARTSPCFEDRILRMVKAGV